MTHSVTKTPDNSQKSPTESNANLKSYTKSSGSILRINNTVSEIFMPLKNNFEHRNKTPDNSRRNGVHKSPRSKSIQRNKTTANLREARTYTSIIAIDKTICGVKKYQNHSSEEEDKRVEGNLDSLMVKAKVEEGTKEKNGRMASKSKTRIPIDKSKNLMKLELGDMTDLQIETKSSTIRNDSMI